MKKRQLITHCIILTGLTVVHATSAATIGLKLGVNANGGVQTGFLLPDQIAGAPEYEQANWMTLGRWGDNAAGQFAVTDSTGADTGILLNWDATGAYAVEGSGTATDYSDPQINLMNPYADSNGNGNVPLTNSLANGVYGQNANNKPLVYLSGLSAWLATQGASYYDVVVYSDGDNQAGRAGEYWIQHASGPYTNIVYGADMTTHVFIRDFNNFHNNPFFQQVPQSSDQGRVAGSGNYTVFRGLSADSLLIRTAEFNTRAPINAVQIVPRATASGATLEPLPSSAVYAGATAAFRIKAHGVVPMTFQWLKNGSPLSDGGNISGATTAVLKISGASAADAGAYSVTVSNSSGVVTSSAAELTVLPLPANSYAEKIVTNMPVAYWRFNETGDPSTNNSPAYDLVGGFHALYGPLAQNAYYGIEGPRPPEYPGFETSNGALQTFASSTTPLPYPSAYVSWAVAPPLNLNTNTATMCAWIYPTGPQVANAAIVFSRGSGSDIHGFGYGGGANLNTLGYTWNNRDVTYNFGSGLSPASNQWSFVACVVTPTNAVLYLYTKDGQFTATNAPVDGHTNAAFAGLTMIGDDPSSTSTPQNRAFNGRIDEVGIFNRALSDQELYSIFKKGLNVGIIPAGIAVNPVSAGYFEGRTARLSAVASGDRPISYQWRLNGQNLTNGGRISGANSANLMITGITMADAGTYTLQVNNIAGVPATSAPAELTVVASNTVPTAYEAALRQANPIAYWRLNESAGSTAYDYWGGNIATHTNTTVGVAGPQSPDYAGLEPANQAVSYDGIASATETGVGYLNNRAQFSIIGWFNSTGVQAARAGLFGQNDVAEFGFHGADLGIWTPGGGFASFAGMGQNMINPGQWYFVAATGDGSRLSLYLLSTNLAMQTSVSGTTTNYGNSAHTFRIGGDGILDATLNHFFGQIDEVAVFDRALSAGEVASLFAAAAEPTGVLPPAIVAQPASSTVFPGENLTISVTALGSDPLSYQWRKGGVNLANGGRISGATSPVLTITAATAADAGQYDVVVTNPGGSATSEIADITLPTSEYETVAVGLSPIAYWRFNELTDPASGVAQIFDSVRSVAGTYGAASLNGANGVAGPRPADGFSIFETTNTALQTVTAVANGYATVPALGITTNVLTITAWINPASYVERAGIVFARAGQPATGLNLISTTNLNYHWLDTAGSYNWNSGLTVPLNQWSFVALVVEPDKATIHLINGNGAQSAVNTITHAARAFTDTIRIGGDPNSDARTFDGRIDEVAIFPYALSASQLLSLYQASPAVTLDIERSGANLILTWPSGTLMEANEAAGPYTTVNASSPHVVTPTEAKKFYRVRVP